MNEHPIAYSTPMVKAVLDCRKKMTRRILKVKGCKPFVSQPEEWTLSDIEKWNKDYHPYGQVGDLLWVREEHLITFENHFWTIEYKDETVTTMFYKKLSLNLNERLASRKTLGKWQRARFLPKELSRIWLKITNIKVERLQDISEEDAMNEGVEYEWYDQSRNIKIEAAKSLFKKLWQVINGRESWEANPWVWAIEFEVLSTTGKPTEL